VPPDVFCIAAHAVNVRVIQTQAGDKVLGEGARGSAARAADRKKSEQATSSGAA